MDLAPPALVDIVPPAMLNKPPLADPTSKALADVFVNVPVSVSVPRLTLMLPAVFETMPDSVRVPVPLFVKPAPLVISDPIAAATLAVIVGFEPAKPSVPPVSV